MGLKKSAIKLKIGNANGSVLLVSSMRFIPKRLFGQGHYYAYKYDVMKLRFLFLLLIGLSILSCETDTSSRKPNIILINIDDMGWKDLGFMGGEYYETPNLDKLSKLGMTFSNAYASAANCAPSRASLMTGKWTTRHGIYTVGSSERGKSKNRKLIPVNNTTTLSKEHKVFPELLNEFWLHHNPRWEMAPE